MNYSSPSALTADYNISGSVVISAALSLDGHSICAAQGVNIKYGGSISGPGEIYTGTLNISKGSLSSAGVYVNNIYISHSSTLNATFISPLEMISSYGTVILNQDYLNSSTIDFYPGSSLQHNLFTYGGVASFTGSSTEGQSFPHSFGGSGAGGGNDNTGGSNGGSTYCPGGELGAPTMPSMFGGSSSSNQNGAGPCGSLINYTLNISTLNGAGGGAGGTSTQYGAGANGGGGSQGLILIGQVVNLNGTVNNNGQAGLSVEGAGGGGGGGGGAGVVELLYTKSENHASASIEVSGGAGGTGYNGAAGGVGGDGEVVAFQVPQSVLLKAGVSLTTPQPNSTGSLNNATTINQTNVVSDLNNTNSSTALNSIYNSLNKILKELGNINSTLNMSISNSSSEVGLLKSVESGIGGVYNTTLGLEAKETSYLSNIGSSLQKLNETIAEMGYRLAIENRTILSILNVSLSNSKVKSLISDLGSELSSENRSISKLLYSSSYTNNSTSRISSSILNLSAEADSASNLLRNLETRIDSVNSTILSLKYGISNYTSPINYSLSDLRSAINNISQRLTSENKNISSLINNTAIRGEGRAPVYNEYYYSICNYTPAKIIEEEMNSNLTAFLSTVNKTYTLLASKLGSAFNRSISQDLAGGLTISNISMLSNVSQRGKTTMYRFSADPGQSEALTVNCGGESDTFEFSALKTEAGSASLKTSPLESPFSYIYSSLISFTSLIRAYIYGI
ncbi:MAG: hypothetical protein ACP5MT_03215 [Candidatus Acidifodinimicrobium sp.]